MTDFDDVPLEGIALWRGETVFADRVDARREWYGDGLDDGDVRDDLYEIILLTWKERLARWLHQKVIEALVGTHWSHLGDSAKSRSIRPRWFWQLYFTAQRWLRVLRKK